MAIKFSPGCNCCDDDPPCKIVEFPFTTGTSFNTTNWSSSGTPVYVAEDTIRIGGSGTETLTPLLSMGTPNAYYVQFDAKMASGTLTFAQDTDTIVWDFTNDTCQVNAIAASNFNEHNGDWVRCNAYFCPTHSMGEVRPTNPLTVWTAYSGSTNSDWGTTTVDEADPTVTTSWTLQASTTCELRNLTFWNADVETDYYLGITELCGYHDLFPFHYPYWEDWTQIGSDTDRATATIDLTATGLRAIWTGSRYSDADTLLFGNVIRPAGTPVFYGNWNYSPVVSPNPQWWTTSYGPIRGATLLGHRTTPQQIYFNGYSVGFGIFALYFQAAPALFVERPAPTHSEPYPVPIAKASLNWAEIIFDGSGNTASAETTMDLVDVPGGTWTLVASDGTTSLTWNHP